MHLKEIYMEKKYILTDETIEYLGHTLHRIKAVRDFDYVKAGDLGGFIESEKNLDHIESEKNLDHDGNARVSGDAWVSDDARVLDNARVLGDAWVLGDAMVSGNADYTTVHGFGRYFRTTTFFRCNNGVVRCQCGCFYGSIDEFRAKVRETHGNSKYAKEYLMIADLMELHFKED